ncbi:transcription initiation factor TFIID subunit 3 isoform X1 [Hemiscyllium ocellatum]|uniref:transcription initiation factor TFIID subunit 3 isoform X1 n=2 Tax=Hemiscyllium ocellatum TaxID=170820 RepID=UPI0029661398|nr:transcription initiation factor TFIID subunit 3 isoform X1 [Hemiscyllium ocellatum]
MCDTYGRALLRVAVAQICQALGWDSVQVTACDILTDVLNRYIEQLTRGCHRYSELYGRTDPVLDDLGQAFKLMGISLSELEDYIHNLEPIGFAHQIPAFPVSKNNVLQFPQPGTKSLADEKEYIPEYMPPLISSQEEEEEEQVPTDGGTSAEAMQVPLEEEEEDMEEEEAVNDENFLGKRPLESPDSVDLPVAKRARTAGCKIESPDGVLEPREPLSMINSQRVPPVLSPVAPPDHSSSLPLSPEPPMLAPIPKPSQLSTPKSSDSKILTSKIKSKISSSPIQKSKFPKSSQLAFSGSPIRSPKTSLKTDKKSPMRTKSPKSPKSPKVPANVPHSTAKNETPNRTPLPVCNPGSEKLGKESVHTKQPHTSTELEKPNVLDTSPKKMPVPDKSIDDSIDAVIARACAEREPDPFEFSSGSESESEIFTSPRRLTISESSTPRMLSLSNSFSRGSVTPVLSSGPTTSTNVSWTLDDSINEVVRKASLGTPPSVPPSVPDLSSPSASPPTPEPLLKLYEERTKHASSSDVKKKLKKEIKMKIKKKEKEKLKDKDRDKKEKGKDKEKNKDKEKETNKDSKIFLREFGKEHEKDPFKFRIKDFDESEVKLKHKDGSFKKDKEKHKEKKKDKEKGKKEKEKNKDKDKHKAKAPSAGFGYIPKEVQLPSFSTPSSVKTQCVLPAVSPMVPERLFEEKSKEKDKKKDKKEKKKKKDKDKERMKEKEKKEKEKKEKEKEKEKHKNEKAKPEPIVPAPSPVIPRLTLRVGAGQDKIVISKVVPVTEAKPSPPAGHPKTPPPPSPAPTPIHIAPPVTPTSLPVPTAVPSPAPTLPVISPAVSGSGAGASKTPVRSVVTETVSTYVIRDEWGNQIWICPGCNKPDDGSPMIGCDDCDDWYHWPCVGISAAPPDEVQWFCPKCINKKKEKKHKRKKSRAH